MKTSKTILSVLLLAGTLVVSVAPVGAQEGVLAKVAANPQNYCHMKFPAIREETLYSARPVLKDASDGDIINFSGPCDHDPAGKDEVLRQRAQLRRPIPEDRR